MRQYRNKERVPKIEVYNEVENDAGNAYLYNAIAGFIRKEDEESNYNKRIFRHVDEDNDADKGNWSDMRVSKPLSKNARKSNEYDKKYVG